MLFSIGKKERALFVLVVQWPPLKYNNPILAQKKSCSYLETTHPAFHIKVHNNTIAITTKYIEKKRGKKKGDIFFNSRTVHLHSNIENVISFII